jgi:hypothetical protein
MGDTLTRGCAPCAENRKIGATSCDVTEKALEGRIGGGSIYKRRSGSWNQKDSLK